jgi:hypothetical protein
MRQVAASAAAMTWTVQNMSVKLQFTPCLPSSPQTALIPLIWMYALSGHVTCLSTPRGFRGPLVSGLLSEPNVRKRPKVREKCHYHGQNALIGSVVSVVLCLSRHFPTSTPKRHYSSFILRNSSPFARSSKPGNLEPIISSQGSSSMLISGRF